MNAHLALALTTVMTLSVSMANAYDNAQIIDSGMQHHGALAVNQAAGDSNLQSNQRAIANAEQGAALASIHTQQIQDAGGDNGGVHTASIAGASFSDSHGLIGVNQAAGQGNAAVNAVAIAQGQTSRIQMADEGLLANTSGGGAIAPAAPQQNSTQLSPAAFDGSSGVVQLNQMAGKQNQALNALAIRIAAP